jgi:glycosyltransferase involved in cell wall biosynthesis
MCEPKIHERKIMTTEFSNPLVSMIVVCYNQSRYVVETLESVKAQTYKPTQLVIIDDCSSDDSVTVIENWLRKNEIDCTFVRHERNQGICKTVNEALSLTRGKYISPIASDDIWLPDKITRQVEIMEAQPDDVGVIYSDAIQIDEHGQTLPGLFIASHWNLPEMPQGYILTSLFDGNFVVPPTTLIRKSCYDKVGVYDEDLPWEDWDMWMRIARHYSFLCSAVPFAKYRLHDKSYTGSDSARIARESCRVCLKQIALGDLSIDQKSKLTARLLNMSEDLYKKKDPEARNILLALWRATGHRRAAWMYRFSRCGISYEHWQRAIGWRLTLLRKCGAIGGSVGSLR